MVASGRGEPGVEPGPAGRKPGRASRPSGPAPAERRARRRPDVATVRTGRRAGHRSGPDRAHRTARSDQGLHPELPARGPARAARPALAVHARGSGSTGPAASLDRARRGRTEGWRVAHVRPLATVPVLSISSPAVPADELPPLEDSWAWAHMQLSGQLGGGRTLETVLASEPHNVCSRLLCPRKLEPEPALRGVRRSRVRSGPAGRARHSGQPPPRSRPHGRSTMRRHRSSCPSTTTGSSARATSGRFRGAGPAARAAHCARATVGMRPMDIGRPGFGMPDAPPDAAGPDPRPRGRVAGAHRGAQ
jgi:hypothetical protein